MTEPAPAAQTLDRDLGKAALALLADLVAFDTTSSDSNLELIAYVEDYLKRFGVASQRIASEDGCKANLFATIGEGTAGGIVLSGHTDVVPVTGQDWQSDPFTLKITEDRLYGRGTSDMKTFLALALAAVPHLAGRTLACPVHLAFSYDEEVGCLGAPGIIADMLKRGIRPAVAIIGEPTEMAIVCSHKSVNVYEVEVTGREAHSSLVHEGISANMVAIDLLAVLAQTARRERAQFTDDRFTPGWSTLTVGKIAGGEASNILAKTCRFTFDLRCVPTRDPVQVLAEFDAAVDAARAELAAFGPELGIGVTRRSAVPPLREEANGAAEAVVRRLTGANGPMEVRPFGTEAGQFQQSGISTIMCGPGSIAQAHKPDEFIAREQLDSGARFFARLVEYACD